MATHLVRGLLGSLLVLVPRDTDVEAVGGKADRRRTSYPRVRARDDRYRHSTSIPSSPRTNPPRESIDGRWNLDNGGIVVQAANEARRKELVMDVNGAKALKKRLGKNGAGKAPPAAEPADVPADAPPVYHWTGKTPPETARAEAEDDSAPRHASLFSRLSFSFR